MTAQRYSDAAIDLELDTLSVVDFADYRDQAALVSAIGSLESAATPEGRSAHSRHAAIRRHAASQILVRSMSNDTRRTDLRHDNDTDFAEGRAPLSGYRLVYALGAAHELLSIRPDRILYSGIRAYNRAIAHFCGAEDALRPCGIVSLANANCAVMAIERCARLGVSACIISLGESDISALADDRFDGVWRTLAATKTPMVVHPGLMFTMNDELPCIGGQLANDNQYLRNKSAEISRCVVGTLAEAGVLERFPDLRIFVVQSGAGWLPSLLAELAPPFELELDAAPTEAANIVGSGVGISKCDQVRRQVRVCPASWEDADELMEVIDPEMLVFGNWCERPAWNVRT